MSPVRHVSSPRLLTQTAPGERPPGAWRYSSHLALVLSGGGARGAYHVGVLAGLAERLPGLEFPILSGMSVGAINTFYLAAHPGPLASAVAGLREQWDRLTSDEVYRVRPARLAGSVLRWVWHGATGRRRGPVAVHGLADTEPLRAFLAQSVDPGGIDANIVYGRLRSVALSAMSYTTGRSVTFVQGAAETPTWARAERIAMRNRLTLGHVMAAAAIPIRFTAGPAPDRARLGPSARRGLGVPRLPPVSSDPHIAPCGGGIRRCPRTMADHRALLREARAGGQGVAKEPCIWIRMSSSWEQARPG